MSQNPRPSRNNALRLQVGLTLGGLFLVSLLSGLVGYLGVHRTTTDVNRMTQESFPSVLVANDLKTALLDQRGLVASFILDKGNPYWIQELQARRADFQRSLFAARRFANSDLESEILDKIERTCREYNNSRDEAISQFSNGQSELAKSNLLEHSRELYAEVKRQCDALIELNDSFMTTAVSRIHQREAQARWFTSFTIAFTCLLGGGLTLLLVRRIFLPLKQLADEARHLIPEPGNRDEPADQVGELSAIRGSFERIAEQTTLVNNRLQLTHKQLEKAEQLASVGQMAAGVAHEIRNLLTTMKLWSYSLRTTRFDDENVQSTFEVMRGELARMEQLVGSFLDCTRPPELNQRRVPVADLAEEAATLVRPRLADKNLQLLQIIDPETPEILADSEQLKLVLVTLLINACDAAFPGGTVTLRVNPEQSIDAVPLLVLRVVNTGTPVPNENRARIFEPYFTTKSNGVGLGLAMAAAIARRHGGDLRLECSSEEGTVFALRLPLRLCEQ